MTLTHRPRSDDRHVLNAVCFAYVAYIPFDILPVAFGRTLTAPLGLLLIVTWIFSGLRRHEKINFPRSAGTLLFLYCLWITFTVFWAVDTDSAMAAAQTILLQAPLVVILSDTLGHLWLRAVVTLGCSASVLGLVVLTRPADALRGGRASVGGIDENITAMVLVVGFAALAYAATRLGARRAALLVPPAVVTGAATLHTGSRTGAIAVVAVLIVALLPLIRRGRLRPVVWLRAIGILLLAYFSYRSALDAGLLPQRVVDLLTQSADYGDPGRGAITGLYLQTFDHWALFGVGVGNDASYLQMTQSVYANSHSLFWKTWIETGLVGLTLFASLLIVVVRRGFRSVASQALLPLAVPLFLFAITLGGQSANLFFFVIALALTQRHPERQSTQTAQPQICLSLPQRAGQVRRSATK